MPIVTPHVQQKPYIITSSTNSSTDGAFGIEIWRTWVESSASVTALDGNWCHTNYPEVHMLGTSATNQVWTVWASQTALSGTVMVRRPANDHRVLTSEQRAAQAAREAELTVKYEREKTARILAEQKAEILLRQMLTPEQKESLEQKKCFFLHTPDGKKFRIDRGRTGNVKLVNARDEVIESYCIHPKIACPDADTMLAQKLLIETDLEQFERVANISARLPGGRSRSGVGLTG